MSLPLLDIYNENMLDASSSPGAFDDTIIKSPLGHHDLTNMDLQGEKATDTPLVDAAALPEMWAELENGTYNIVGALNICQGKFDNRTLWQRAPDGQYTPHTLAAVDCLALRSSAENNTTANNKIYASELDYINEKAIAFAALYAYNASKYSKETVQGTARQQAAKRGAASRKANKEKRKEVVTKDVVKELLYLKEWQGQRDEEWKNRFDWIISNVLDVTGVKIAPGSL